MFSLDCLLCVGASGLAPVVVFGKEGVRRCSLPRSARYSKVWKEESKKYE
jgi:hypothetical protein